MPSAYFKGAVAIAVVAGHQYDRGMSKAIPFLLVLARAALRKIQLTKKRRSGIWRKRTGSTSKPMIWRSIARYGTRISLAGHLSAQHPSGKIT